MSISLTNITLLSGIPFYSDYAHIRKFDSKQQQMSYFNSKTTVYGGKQPSYQRGELQYTRLNVNIEDIRNVNYMLFQNDNKKQFFAFVHHIKYINQRTTEIYFTIDVFQTWQFDLEYKPSFITREHKPMFGEDGLTPLKYTVDEELTYGNVLETKKDIHYGLSESEIHFLVVVSKESLHSDKKEIIPSIIATPQPLSYYVFPFSKKGDTFTEVFHNGSDSSNPTHKIDCSPISHVMQALAMSEENANQVVSMYVTDYFGLPYKSPVIEGGTNRVIFDKERTENYVFIEATIGNIDEFPVKGISIQALYTFTPMNFANILNYNDHFYNNDEKEGKLYMFPYSQIVMTDYKGNGLTIQPQELLNDKIELWVHGSLGLNNKVSYSIRNYGNSFDVGELPDRSILDTSIIDANPNDIPIVVDSLASYLQGNRNSLQNTLEHTVFSGTVNGIASAVSIGNSATRVPSKAGGNNQKSEVDNLQNNSSDGILGAVQGLGNMYYSIEGMYAKAKDIDNTPPSVANLGGNIAFDLGNDLTGVSIKFKTVTNEYRNLLRSFFRMYGYKVMLLKTPELKTRAYWNYIETKGINIQANINNNDLQSIKNIFDGGVTIWHTDDIGNYNLENEVL